MQVHFLGSTKFGNMIVPTYYSCLLDGSRTSTVYQNVSNKQRCNEWHASKCWKDQITTVKGMSKGYSMFPIFCKNMICYVISTYNYTYFHENDEKKNLKVKMSKYCSADPETYLIRSAGYVV